MGQNRIKHRINSYLINHCPTSEGVREVSERVSAAERASKASRAEQAQRVSGVSERANGQASGPVLQSVFLVVLAHCVQCIYPLVFLADYCTVLDQCEP